MKLSKKILAIVLSTVMLFSTFAVAFTATAIKAVTPVIFVPGIGQSQTYKYDDEGNVIDDWNMLHLNTDFASYSLVDWVKVLRFVSSFMSSIAHQKDIVSQSEINGLLEVLFADHLTDENGDTINNVVTPNYNCPVSEYNEEAAGIFSRRIPCQELIDKIGGNNVYCYNYSIFSNLAKNAQGLNDYIENVVLKQTGAQKVILVPMSMGATVVNEYINLYPDANRISKVISVVGAWNGSDVFADLMLAKFDQNAPSLVYTDEINKLGLVEPMVGNIINIAARILPKQELDNFLYDAIESFVKTLILGNTELISLCPAERYSEFSSKYLTDEDLTQTKAQTDSYAAAQANLKERLYYQRDTYGTEFYFISGYNLGFGDCDYGVFHFFDSYDETNSDEIIQISSTAPGTSFVPAGTKFDDEYCADSSHHMSPDCSIDTSTCYFENTSWYFSGQKHELTDNNTALNLAFSIALGQINSVQDCEDIYPQFNESRDLRKLTRDYLPDAKSLSSSDMDADSYSRLTSAIEAAEKMKARTINDRDEDDKIIANLKNTLIEINTKYNLFTDKYQAPVQDKSSVAEVILGIASNIIGKIFGEKGFADFWSFIL